MGLEYLRSRTEFRERVESKEQSKTEREGFLTTCHRGGRSYRGPMEYYNREFRFWPLGPVIKSVFRLNSVRIVNKAFWSYLPLEAQSF